MSRAMTDDIDDNNREFLVAVLALETARFAIKFIALCGPLSFSVSLKGAKSPYRPRTLLNQVPPVEDEGISPYPCSE
jgi:hypothetical protein